MLKQIREEKGLTQAALAKQAGLSIRTIQGWEQGRRSPVSPDFFKLVQALDISADQFASIFTPPEPEKPARKRKKGE